MGNVCMSSAASKDACEPLMSRERNMDCMPKLQHRNKLEYLDSDKSVANIDDMPWDGDDALV